MAKSKTKGVKYWKKKAWTEFSPFVRVRDALRTTGGVDNVVCCSCGIIKPVSAIGGAQAGHLVPGRGNSILFCELGVHAQCYHCNSTDFRGLKGNWPDYRKFMMKHYGIEAIELLLQLRDKTIKFLPYELEELRDLYKRLTKQMLDTKELPKGETYEEYKANIGQFDSRGTRLLILHRVLDSKAEGRDILFATGN